MRLRAWCGWSVMLLLSSCVGSEDGILEVPTVPNGSDAAAAPRDAGPARSVLDATIERDASFDAGCIPFVRPPDCADESDGGLPTELRCSGLYGDWPRRELACDVLPYEPAFTLWSDGARKRRFVSLPKGATIDVSDPDAFVYPPGTQFWKEFSVQTAKGVVLAETRLLRKLGDGWRYGTYVWSEDAQSALRTDVRVDDLFGSGYTVPEHAKCLACHQGRRDFVLGWDLLLLGDGAHGVTRQTLQQAGRLREKGALAAPSSLSIPGDAVERAALGYLHVNCGVSCHNPSVPEPLPIFLRLESSQLTGVQVTPAVQTAVNRTPGLAAQLFAFGLGGPYYDIRPGDVTRSLILTRMHATNAPLRMPRLGSNVVDPDGVAAVTAWIANMTPERGYPRAAP